MPLGIVSDEELADELKRFNSDDKEKEEDKQEDKSDEDKEIEQLAKDFLLSQRVKRHPGRTNAPAVPPALRALIAQEAIVGVKRKEVAEIFGVSTEAVKNYKNSSTSNSTYNTPNEQLKEANDRFRNTIKELASTKLIEALHAITSDKLVNARLNVTSSVARDMSNIIKNVSPQENAGNQMNNQVIVYTPGTRKMEDYEVIEVGH